jgi:hypothetical protein
MKNRIHEAAAREALDQMKAELARLLRETQG